MPPKSVLITGCSAGGIGHALAVTFQARGLTVFATARSVDKMSSLADLPNVHLIPLDVTSPSSIAAAVKEVQVKTAGKLDILVNNAGVNYIMPALDTDIEIAKAVFETNYWGSVRIVQGFAELIISAKGTIVNVGSLAGILNLPFQSQYNASKAAVNMFSETLRLELAPLGVNVVTLLAGNVASNIGANAPTPHLPSDSRYKAVEEHIAADAGYSDMPTSQFATQVVADVLGGASGNVLKGANSGIVKWLVPFLPQFVIDRLMVINGRGLAKMPKTT